MTTTTQTLSSPTSRPLSRGVMYLLALLAILLLAIGLRAAGFAEKFPEWLNLGLRAPIDQFKSWVIGNRASHPMFLFFFDPISDTVDLALRGLERFLLAWPWPALIIAVGALAYKAAGRGLALFALAGFLLMGCFGLWKESIQTLASWLSRC